MIEPKTLAKLQEINRLKLERERLEKEAAELWKMKSTGGRSYKISTLHTKMNRLSSRITYLFNLKAVANAIWNTDRKEAHAIIYKDVDSCWDYDIAVNGGTGCSWCDGVCRITKKEINNGR